MSKYKTAARYAFSDITKYFAEINITPLNKKEVWVVTPYSLGTKKNRRLNKELGIKNINYST